MFSFSVDAHLSHLSSLWTEASGSGAERDNLSLLERTIEEVHPQIRAEKRQFWRLILGASGLLLAVYAWMCFFRPFGTVATKDFSNAMWSDG